ncbi:MAG: UvrD-helicase domain-containing protein [Polyangiales bacterium]
MNIDGLIDGPARRAIREALGETLVVEAAAGTGKTTELVQRIVAVIEGGLGRLGTLVAVTFTEKAAGEMKLRVRTELDRALSTRADEPVLRERLVLALAELETAKVGTIHALCTELLRENPIEAGIDPAFEVADAMQARALLERAFDGWFEPVLEVPPDGLRRVLARRAVDERGKGARELLLMASSRLVETRDFRTPYRRDPLDREAEIDAMIAQLAALSALATASKAARDPLRLALASLAQQLGRVRARDHDTLEALLRVIARDRSIWGDRKGAGEWYAPGVARADVVARRSEARAALDACVRRLDADLAACLSRELTPVVAAYEAEKRAQGTLDFFDLLLATRDLLRDHRDVRARMQGALTQLFVDEFQDTDPLQTEILLLLAADDPNERDPFRARPVPGKLFVVGDPKQSIYRFRRADVALYERIKRHLVGHGARVLELSTSFRSLPAIQSLINAAFAPRMAGDSERGQARYVPLAAHRPARTGQPAIIALPAPKPYSEYGRLTKREVDRSLPDAVGAFVDWLLRKSKYVVHEDGRDVPLEARHVCLLFRRFRAYGDDVTREYVRALEARGIPHVLSGGRAFHAREEVIALRAVLSAIEWPDDALHVYATLRGPFVALHDAQLLGFKRRVGHLHPLGPVDRDALAPSDLEVADALQLLAGLHRGRNRRPFAETLGLFLRGVRAHAGIAIWPAGEQALGNVLRVLDYARGHERGGRVSSFRGFVEWLDQHASLGEAADATVVEERSDGARIMTIHAAKGLEFPVVVLCDPCAPLRAEYASRFVDPERNLWAQALCDAEPIELVEQRDRVREHDEAELVRLAYVAATRAKELLVVPVVGEGHIDGWIDLLRPAVYPPPERRRTPELAVGCPRFGGDSVLERPARLLHGAEESVAPGMHQPAEGAHQVVWWDPYLLDLTRRATGGVTQQELLRVDAEGTASRRGLEAYEAHRAARDATLARGATPTLCVRTITALAQEQTPGLADARVEVLDSGVDRFGRPSGTRFGSLMHALLEHAVLADADASLPAQARFLGRGLGASEDEIARAVSDTSRALTHPLFARARAADARGALFREAPVLACEAPDALREGVVDLAFREGEGAAERLVLVDFKTDVVLDDLTVYTRQLTLYADALARALSLPVECVLFRV